MLITKSETSANISDPMGEEVAVISIIEGVLRKVRPWEVLFRNGRPGES